MRLYDRSILRSANKLSGSASQDRSRWRPGPLAACGIVAVALALSIGAGVLAITQLRDALTVDMRAQRATALRMELMQQAAAPVARTPVTALPPAGIGAAAGPSFDATLGALAVVTHDLDVDGSAQLIGTLAALNERRLAGGTVDAAMRAADRQLRRRILATVLARRAALGAEFLRIVVLFVGSVALGIAGIALAAGVLVRLDRARHRAESALRERELIDEQGRTWSQSFQRAVLPPRLPAVSGCRFDAVYEPGASDASVGGDWYDALRLADGRILLSIGDVAGSGIEAAVVMGVVRQILRGIAQLHADPALMLDAADRALRIEYADVFATVWVGMIDMVTRTLSFASAGHPPVILASPAGAVCELRDFALPVGLRDGSVSSTTTIPLTDGATLVLYTDGLTEATRDLTTGDALLQAAAARVAVAAWSRPAAQIVADVLAAGATDDVAVLVARIDFAAAESALRRLRFDVRDCSAAREARDTFVTVLAGRGFPPIERLNAELVFGELVGNVVRHAAPSTEVEIAIDFGGPQTVLHVLDRGPGFRHISRLPADPFSESGRGLFLIAAMTDDFSVSERAGGGSHARAVLVGRLPRALTAPSRVTQSCS